TLYSLSSSFFIFYPLPRPPPSTLSPYTTLFRSRISDHVGPRAIGHISQMLVHLPRESTRAIAPEAEKAAVIDHLERQGVPAKVRDRKSTRLNSSHVKISYAVFCLKKKKLKQKMQ